MNREEVLYLVPYVLSLALSLGVFWYSWRHRHVRGARAYTWFVAGQTLTILGFIFELISPNLEIKILWDKFQWLTTTYLVILPFLIFSIQYSEHKLRNLQLTWSLWLAIPVIFTILLLTDSFHHLLYPNPHLSADFPFPELQYDFTFVVYIYAFVYVYGANLYGLGLLIKRASQPYNLHRLQYLTIIAGFLIPVLLSLFSLANIKIAPQRDIAPFSLAIGNMIVAWGLFRYRLFDLIPIARDHIVENMKDPVIVLDSKNRVVDMNQAALKILGKNYAQVVGRPSSEVFASWPVIVSELEYLDVEQREISIREGGDTFFFDVNISSIYSNRQQLIGRIIVARDVTKYKTLESGYRLLSEELEQRVRERTEELRHSAERYRAVVENQTEFIVQWKPDGTRTFVNEAYCRYWGLTYDQALSSHVMSHLAKEDRHAVEEKISRLTSGAISSETEIHRVVRPDGSIGWQEWTDQAILDEFGQVVEFQSVGRDITTRKQAEDNLRKSEERFSKAFRASPIMITISQLSNSRLLEVNDTFEKITAYKREEVIGRTTFELGLWVNPEDRDRLLTILHTNGQLRNDEVQFRIRNGNIIIVLVSAELIELGGEKCVLSTIEDITERRRAEANLVEAYETTLEGWAKALELRDKETEGHSRRVTETTLVVARAMGFDEEELIHIRHGTILHDIGKMAIPDEILRKPGPLTDSEREIVMHHPKVAYDLLVRIPHLKKALEIPYLHHEKWDGTGYPRGLKGDEIPLSARIFAVVDVWDALSSDRPYRKAWSKEKVAQYINAEEGKHFDPKVVTVFLQLLEQGKI